MTSGRDDLSEVAVEAREWPAFPANGWQGARRWDWVFTSLFTVWLVADTVTAVRLGRPAIILLPLMVAYGGGFLLVLWVAPRWLPPARIVLVGVMYALGACYLSACGPSTSLAMLAYALTAAVMLLPLAASRVIVVLTIATVVGLSWLMDGELDEHSTVVVGLVGLLALSVSRMTRLVGKLASARSEIQTLAVAHERARLARDLHDVLGHNLTAITVKASLARRLLETDQPVDAALSEIRDVEELSRRTLGEVRATVAGQRRMSLPEELASARTALRAAGIEADLPLSAQDVETRLEEPLAFVLREGVTNVVRHSSAHRCSVRFGRRWVEIVDDGVGSPGDAGNGLSGLAERLAAVDGTIEAGPLPTGGFRLKAEVS